MPKKKRPYNRKAETEKKNYVQAYTNTELAENYSGKPWAHDIPGFTSDSGMLTPLGIQALIHDEVRATPVSIATTLGNLGAMQDRALKSYIDVQMFVLLAEIRDLLEHLASYPVITGEPAE